MFLAIAVNSDRFINKKRKLIEFIIFIYLRTNSTKFLLIIYNTDNCIYSNVPGNSC